MFHLETGADGARSADGLVEGTYLHGLFANDANRRAWLVRVGGHTLSAAVDLNALFRSARRPNLIG